MPTLTRLLLRLSLLALLGGSGIGAWRLAHPLTPGAAWRAVHVELMLFGWLVPFVLGTAYWMLPRAAAQPERGNPRLAWIGVLLLTLGLAAGAVARLAGGPAAWQHLATATRSAGILVLLLLLWPRIKPFRTAASQPARRVSSGAPPLA